MQRARALLCLRSSRDASIAPLVQGAPGLGLDVMGFQENDIQEVLMWFCMFVLCRLPEGYCFMTTVSLTIAVGHTAFSLHPPCWHRNILLPIGCLASPFAGCSTGQVVTVLVAEKTGTLTSQSASVSFMHCHVHSIFLFILL